MAEIVKPVSPSLKLLKDYGWLVAVALIVAQQFGWLTAEQIATIKRVIPVESKDSTTETITVETETKPVDKSPQVPVSPPVAKLSPQDIETIAELFRTIFDELKPKPAPVDPKPVDPKPVDPKPLPVDPVTPTDSRIVITDETGKPLTAATVDAGALFLATAPGGSQIGWQVSKHGSARIATLPANAGYAFSLDAGSFVEYFLTDYAAKTQTSIRITCNAAPQPPPNVVPDVRPVDPLPTVVGRVSLRVVHNVTAIKPEMAIVLNATDTWNSFTAAGSDWLFYDITDPKGAKVKADAGSVAVPVLVIYDKVSGVKLEAIPLPKSVEELRSVVAKYTGGK